MRGGRGIPGCSNRFFVSAWPAWSHILSTTPSPLAKHPTVPHTRTRCHAQHCYTQPSQKLSLAASPLYFLEEVDLQSHPALQSKDGTWRGPASFSMAGKANPVVCLHWHWRLLSGLCQAALHDCYPYLLLPYRIAHLRHDGSCMQNDFA